MAQITATWSTVALVMHAGLEGVLPNYSAVLTHSQVAPLRSYVDYLALGHIHKPFEREDWIYNPGSPETCSVDEVAWPERGYYLVEVDTAQTPKHRARLIRNPRRAFLRLALNVDSCESPAALYAAVERCIKDEAGRHTGDQPVVELALEGVLPFHHHELDVKQLEEHRPGRPRPAAGPHRQPQCAHRIRGRRRRSQTSRRIGARGGGRPGGA